jgi:poly-beta-1,6-N-acetyl-D-glucosamine synthase
MKFLFLISALLLFVTYIGYPLFLCLRASVRPRLVRRAAIFPTVSIVLAARNEEKNLPEKLRNLAALEYPAGALEIIVVSDGSNDATATLLRNWKSFPVQTVLLPERQGKAQALNQGVARARGEIVCFTDARQRIAANALKILMENFADSEVGCASGALLLTEPDGLENADGSGLYWQLEKKIRAWEARAGSVVGATGAFYAVRTENLVALPAGTILDDVYIPMHVARQGKRVIFDPAAVAWDPLSPSPRQEFRRKVRTLTGNYQLLQLAPWLLTSANPLRAQFLCHKLLRLLAPFALLGALSASLAIRQGAFELLLGLQLSLYALAAVARPLTGAGAIARLANVSRAFVLLNTAAAVALVYFLAGKKQVWSR